MRLLIALLCLLTGCLVGGPGGMAARAADEARPLVVIDGRPYLPEDFDHWWDNFRDNEGQRPERIEPFIDWLLMAGEAERMELDTLPEFRRKVAIFLDARSLMFLKHDEVDSKVEGKEADLKARYEAGYVPRRLVIGLDFEDPAQARAFSERAGASLTVGRLQELVKQEEGTKRPAFRPRHPDWLRPASTPEAWRSLVATTQAGTLLGPLAEGAKKALLLYVAEVKGAEAADYEACKPTIRTELAKQQETVLTEALVRRLMDKHAVRIDQQVLEAIDLDKPEANDREQVVIRSDRSTVTVGYFLDQYRKGAALGGPAPADRQAAERLKRQVANAMIANSVVSWEALDRHYESRPPLMWAYQFYRQNRLIRELSERALGTLAVSEAEAQGYYQAHPQDFQRPEQVRAVVVSGPEAALRRVWVEAVSQGDAVQAAKQGKSVRLVLDGSTAVPLAHLPPVARQAVADLAVGAVSQPLAVAGGDFVIVQLLGRSPAATIPFAEAVKQATDQALAAKQAAGRDKLVAALRARSTVRVDDELWAALVKRYRQ